MNRNELLKQLRQLKDGTLPDAFRKGGADDPEVQHSQADKLLIVYIDDEEIGAAYDDIPKWYA